jgi:hypothetical protein
VTAQTCPTPAKVRYATEGAAQLVAAGFHRDLRAYHCPCDWWHLTSKPGPVKPREDTTVTQHVAALDNDDFEALTGADIRGTATPEQAAALRSTINLYRWTDALKAITIDINAQLAARKGDTAPATMDWRRRVLDVQRSLHERRAEAKRLRQQAHAAASIEGQRLASLDTSGPQARAAAGERAIQRLIDAHQGEFGDLLIAEYEAAGLQVPTRIARHAARRAGLATAAPAATPGDSNEPAGPADAR